MRYIWHYSMTLVGHWELGVYVSDQTLQRRIAFSCSGHAAPAAKLLGLVTTKASDASCCAVVPLPFDCSRKYDDQVPWHSTVEEREPSSFPEKDRFGRTGPKDLDYDRDKYMYGREANLDS